MKEIIDYLTNIRGFKIISQGTAPYYMWNIGNLSTNYDNNDFVITLWFSNEETPALVEIQNQHDFKHMFQGHIFDLTDLKTILYLINDCISESGYVDKVKRTI